MELVYENCDNLVSLSKYFEAYYSYMSSGQDNDDREFTPDIVLPENRLCEFIKQYEEDENINIRTI